VKSKLHASTTASVIRQQPLKSPRLVSSGYGASGSRDKPKTPVSSSFAARKTEESTRGQQQPQAAEVNGPSPIVFNNEDNGITDESTPNSESMNTVIVNENTGDLVQSTDLFSRPEVDTVSSNDRSSTNDDTVVVNEQTKGAHPADFSSGSGIAMSRLKQLQAQLSSRLRAPSESEAAGVRYSLVASENSLKQGEAASASAIITDSLSSNDASLMETTTAVPQKQQQVHFSNQLQGSKCRPSLHIVTDEQQLQDGGDMLEAEYLETSRTTMSEGDILFLRELAEEEDEAEEEDDDHDDCEDEDGPDCSWWDAETYVEEGPCASSAIMDDDGRGDAIISSDCILEDVVDNQSVRPTTEFHTVAKDTDEQALEGWSSVADDASPVPHPSLIEVGGLDNNYLELNGPDMTDLSGENNQLEVDSGDISISSEASGKQLTNADGNLGYSEEILSANSPSNEGADSIKNSAHHYSATNVEAGHADEVLRQHTDDFDEFSAFIPTFCVQSTPDVGVEVLADTASDMDDGPNSSSPEVVQENTDETDEYSALDEIIPVMQPVAASTLADATATELADNSHDEKVPFIEPDRSTAADTATSSGAATAKMDQVDNIVESQDLSALCQIAIQTAEQSALRAKQRAALRDEMAKRAKAAVNVNSSSKASPPAHASVDPLKVALGAVDALLERLSPGKVEHLRDERRRQEQQEEQDCAGQQLTDEEVSRSVQNLTKKFLFPTASPVAANYGRSSSSRGYRSPPPCRPLQESANPSPPFETNSDPTESEETPNSGRQLETSQPTASLLTGSVQSECLVPTTASEAVVVVQSLPQTAAAAEPFEAKLTQKMDEIFRNIFPASAVSRSMSKPLLPVTPRSISASQPISDVDFVAATPFPEVLANAAVGAFSAIQRGNTVSASSTNAPATVVPSVPQTQEGKPRRAGSRAAAGILCVRMTNEEWFGAMTAPVPVQSEATDADALMRHFSSEGATIEAMVSMSDEDSLSASSISPLTADSEVPSPSSPPSTTAIDGIAFAGFTDPITSTIETAPHGELSICPESPHSVQSTAILMSPNAEESRGIVLTELTIPTAIERPRPVLVPNFLSEMVDVSINSPLPPRPPSASPTAGSAAAMGFSVGRPSVNHMGSPSTTGTSMSPLFSSSGSRWLASSSSDLPHDSSAAADSQRDLRHRGAPGNSLMSSSSALLDAVDEDTEEDTNCFCAFFSRARSSPDGSKTASHQFEQGRLTHGKPLLFTPPYTPAPNKAFRPRLL
jgi:hypothetical protein